MYNFASMTRNQIERTETLHRDAARARQLSEARCGHDATWLDQLRGATARALRTFAARLDADRSTSPGAA